MTPDKSASPGPMGTCAFCGSVMALRLGQQPVCGPCMQNVGAADAAELAKQRDAGRECREPKIDDGFPWDVIAGVLGIIAIIFLAGVWVGRWTAL